MKNSDNLTPESLLTILQELKFPEIIDSTMLACFSACPQKFYNEYILQLAPMAVSPDLHAGKCFALALETARYAYYAEKLTPQKAIEKAHKEFIKAWGNYEPPINNPKTFENMWAAVENYFEQYPLDEDYLKPVQKADGKPAIEFTFALPTYVPNPETEDPILYCGRFDMLAESEHGLAVVDEKTTKYIRINWSEQWKMRGQLLGYVYAARAFGYNCNMAVVRGVGIQKTQIKHIEVPLIYSEYEIEKWWGTLQLKLEELAQKWYIFKDLLQQENISLLTRLEAARQVFTYDYGDSCSSYNGCPFIHLCTNPKPWEWYSDYAHREWNPLSLDKTENSSDAREFAPTHNVLTLKDFKHA